MNKNEDHKLEKFMPMFKILFYKSTICGSIIRYFRLGQINERVRHSEKKHEHRENQSF